jgi:peptidoglycan-N-acetylglucosamine deacetylase
VTGSTGAPAPVTFSLDLEDHRPADAPWPERYRAITERVLELVEARGHRATVFVVGELADEHPELVRSIAARGHEVALHAWRHVPLTEQDPDTFAAETRRAQELLGELAGRPVVGFRAPTASLVPASAWAVDVLGDLGFTYSSSVLPAPNPLFGWPGAPRDVFRWPNGLVEVPLPVTGTRRVALPLLGGVYFRAVPWPVVRAARRLAERHRMPCMYCHPYDFDPDEPRWAVPDVPAWGRYLLWYNRRRMLAKVSRLLDGPVGPPLEERVAALGSLDVFSPVGREV